MGLLKTGILICFFRRRLDEIPNSFTIFTKTLMIYFCISTILKALIILPHLAFLQTVYEIGLTFAFVGILLLVFRKRTQFVQTLTALLTCESIVAFCTIPVTLWLSVSTSDVILIPFYARGVFLVWGLAVICYILKETLVKEISFSFQLACLYFVQIFGVSSILAMV